MALSREKKQKVIKEIEQNLKAQKIIVFFGYERLKARELFVLRNALKLENCRVFIAKKTLLKIAFDKIGLSLGPEKLPGQIAVIFGFGGELTAAKIAYNFSLQNRNLKILGGIFENSFVAKETVESLAKIPARESLLANLASVVSSPITGFVQVLQANIKGLIYIFSQIK